MRSIALALCGLTLPGFLIGQSAPEPAFRVQIPRAWNDVDVESYELPLSYGKPVQYMSAAEYYAIPARTVYRTYPIYRPDKEPRGYLNWLRRQPPKVVFDPAKLKTEAAWIEAGATVFDAPNVVVDLNELPIRDPDWYREADIPVTVNGIVPLRRAEERRG